VLQIDTYVLVLDKSVLSFEKATSVYIELSKDI